MDRAKCLAALACGVGLLVAANAGMSAYSSYAKWSTMPVVYYLNPANATLSFAAVEVAVQRAATTWIGQSNSSVDFLYGGRVNDTTVGYDSRNVVIFRAQAGDAAIARTYSWFYGSQQVDADIIFNTAGYSWFAGTSGCNNTNGYGVYIEDVGAHEFGHILGLNHSTDPAATMYPTMGACSMENRTLGLDDIAAIQHLYPPTSTPTNTAPSVSIVSPVDGSSTIRGTPVTFSGAATDARDGDLSSKLVWTSSIDGQIGSGSSFAATLSAGYHTVTASVTDSGGLAGARSVNLSITVPCTRGNPTVSLSPSSTVVIGAGMTQRYRATIASGDSGTCSSSTFTLVPTVPVGWTATLGSSAVTLGPGSVASTDVNVTAPMGTPEALYQLALSATNSAATSSAGSVSFAEQIISRTKGDFTGDGKADRAVYDRVSGVWSVEGLGSVGWKGEVPVPADYDGDGKFDFGLWFTSGYWNLLGVATIQWGQSGDIPVPADYDGDMKADVAVFRPSNGYWYVRGVTSGFVTSVQWGHSGDLPVPADYDGDGKTDFAIFRPSDGTWAVKGSAGVNLTFQFGQAGDIPVPADYDGDGRADAAVYRPSTIGGGPRWLVNGMGSWNIGAVGDMPVPQDLTGDGRAELTVYRPTTGTWYDYELGTGLSTVTMLGGVSSRPALLPAFWKSAVGDLDHDRRRDPTIYRPSGGDWWRLKSTGGYQHVVWGGLAGDVPVPGDYDGDGLMDVAIFRGGVWWRLLSGDDYLFYSYRTEYVGQSGDIPLVGDIDGDRKADPMVFRPSDGTWRALTSAVYPQVERSWSWGITGDQPVAADFDGDGVTDITVYRPSNGTWWTLLSASGYTTSRSWTWGGDSSVPVAGDYDGDGITDVAVYYPSTGAWYALLSSSNFTTFLSWTWGLSGDVPIVGDFDDDGKADITVWRPSNGTWYGLMSGSGYSFQYWFWGISGDIPVPSS